MRLLLVITMVSSLAVAATGQIDEKKARSSRADRIELLEKHLTEHPDDTRTLRQLGRAYFFAARSGDTKAAAKSIAALERVRELAPNADIHYDLGTAYMTKLAYVTRQAQRAEDRDSAKQELPIVERAVAEFAAGVKRHPDDAKLISGLGMSRTIRAYIKQRFDEVAPGIALLDKAVELAPKDVHPRLARGFTLMGLPPAAQQSDKVIDDLSVLLKRVEKGRDQQTAGVLHVFRGDVLARIDRTDRAREDYEAARSLESTAAAEARARLLALAKGKSAADAAARFRSTALSCAACHGPETRHSEKGVDRGRPPARSRR